MELTEKLGLKRKKNASFFSEIQRHNSNKMQSKTRKMSTKHHNNLKHKHKNEKSDDITFIQIQSNSQDTTNNYSTPASNPNQEKDGDKMFSVEEMQKYLNTELKDIDEKTLAKNWDWRNVGGNSFVPKPRRQNSCGSCYIFSTVSSLESRLRVMTNNKDKTEFSRQFPLSCSFYTEGCEGGYPILVGKFFNEFEIVPDECFEYEAKNVPCSQVCNYTKYPKKYTVSKYEYLGGFYTATSEVDMMKEIRARGPIPGNITVPWSFSYYSNGIYTNDVEIVPNAGVLSKSTLFDKNISWEKVDHSILIIGWGEEKGVKYWIGMNTWGEEWGENGYFKILRGENECSVESMGDCFRITKEDR